VIGERWALLLVRELLLGAQRFSDLRRALPGASTNMLSDRLREIEVHGVVRRRTLPPPAASSVYELTERGHDLEPVLDAIGSWGSAEPRLERSSLTATSVLLFLRGSARAQPAPPTETHRVQLDERVWTICTLNGQVEIQPHDPSAPDASLHTGPDTATGRAARLGSTLLRPRTRPHCRWLRSPVVTFCSQRNHNPRAGVRVPPPASRRIGAVAPRIVVTIPARPGVPCREDH
jgi:DNA-binding HxlR family transcriptional regulator